MSVYTLNFLQGFRPEKKLSVSEWADAHRHLSSRSSSEPGPWRTSRTPYLKEIMDALSMDNPARTVVFMKASQIGGTEVGLNWIGYLIDHSPAPIMLIQPTVEMAKRNSKQRIDPMIASTRRLSSKVADKRARDSGNTILQKDFPGGTLVMTGANSPIGLRSLPAQAIFCDECEAYPIDVDGEGDPISLAKARARTFSRRKLYLCSTPTVDALSRIKPAYERSDQRKYYVPCPDCNHFQHFIFPNLKWSKGKPNTAAYVCDSCGVLIEEHHKTKMLAKGEWRAENAKGAAARTVGFHLNSLYSPLGWYSWAEIASDWEEAKESKEKLRGFINTVLGETWKDKGEAPNWNRLYERRERYPFGKIPPGGLILVAGADVQKDRIEVEIVAYGREKVSWSIDYQVLNGDTMTDAPWDQLEALLHKTFPMAGKENVAIPIKALGVDSGYNTQAVYSWVRKFDPARVFAVKGQDHLTLPVAQPKAVDVNFRGKRVRRGLKSWPVGSSMLKAELYGFLRLDKALDGEKDPPGYCHFPQYGEEFFKQMTGEEMVLKRVRGYIRREWQKIRERNEAIDCRVYARAAASLIGIDRYTENNWQKFEKELGKGETIARKDAVPKFKRKPRRRESSYWDR